MIRMGMIQYIQRFYIPRLRHGPRWCYLHRGHVSRCPQLRLGTGKCLGKTTHIWCLINHHDSIFSSTVLVVLHHFVHHGFPFKTYKNWIPHRFGQTQVNVYVIQIHCHFNCTVHCRPLQQIDQFLGRFSALPRAGWLRQVYLPSILFLSVSTFNCYLAGDFSPHLKTLKIGDCDCHYIS